MLNCGDRSLPWPLNYRATFSKEINFLDKFWRLTNIGAFLRRFNSLFSSLDHMLYLSMLSQLSVIGEKLNSTIFILNQAQLPTLW